MGYHETYKRWQDDPEAYWLEQAKAIDWTEAPTKALFEKVKICTNGLPTQR